MNEAGLISARVAPAEVEASVLRSRPLDEAVRAPARSPFKRWPSPPIQIGVTLGATVIAFKASLGSLVAGFPAHLALGTLGLVPLTSLLLGLGIGIRRRRPEPDLHDRYLDYILGLGLVGAATAAMWFLPGLMSIFFWSWRLDLVWLPVFVAGAVTLLCGSRALWRYRVPIVFLFLAWPLPYVVGRIPGALSTAATVGLGLVLLASVLVSRGRRITVRRTMPAAGRPGRRAGGGLLAAGLLSAAATLTTVADRQLEAAAPLLEADGQPRLAATSSPASSVDGLSLVAASDLPNLPSWGSSASRRTYQYSGPQATLPGTGANADAGIVVDVIVPADGRVLALSPVTLATLQGYKLEASRVDDLSGGLAANIDRYLSPGGTTSLLVIWWDWPVRSAAGSRDERVIVQRLVPLDQATPQAGLLSFARAFAGSMIGQASGAS